MHMWHHVTNRLIISNDKDSNSDNRIKLRVRDIYHKYSLQQWARVIWSDEAYIYLGDDRGHVFVTWRPDEEYLDECLVPTFKQSPVRVMVWACIMKGRKGVTDA
jgi:hypothetical protein